MCAASAPVLVVLERNPWLMVIGSDSPTFASYDDGTVIYLKTTATQDELFLHRQISRAAQALRAIVPYDLTKFADYYELSSWTDQPTTIIWTPKKTVSIYGRWRRTSVVDETSSPEMKEIIDREAKLSASLPAEIRATLEKIDEERKLPGVGWLPRQVEIMLWPYEYAPDDSTIWPKDWPALSTSNTVRRGNSYSVFLPLAELPRLRELLTNRKEKGGILIEGKKMAVAYRFPFPKEAQWMGK